MWITFKSCIFAFWNNEQNALSSALLLWITFKSCIFAFWNNEIKNATHFKKVVNYIQILYLCILKQHALQSYIKAHCCELHSNLVSLHSETTENNGYTGIPELWITFKSCIFAFWNNSIATGLTTALVVNYIQILYLCILKQLQSYYSGIFSVVNYIQILYLCILKQPEIFPHRFLRCCELHSNLVSLHSETTKWCYGYDLWELWITFKSCIFAFWNNTTAQHNSLLPVVNYIQILYLCILKQPLLYPFSWSGVVNYIQILYLCILKQQTEECWYCHDCCELHSNLVSLHSETTESAYRSTKERLWITFKSCIFAFWNNWRQKIRRYP